MGWRGGESGGRLSTDAVRISRRLQVPWVHQAEGCEGTLDRHRATVHDSLDIGDVHVMHPGGEVRLCSLLCVSGQPTELR